MKEAFRSITEGLARRTTRRGLFGRGAEVATGALLGVAAGTLTRPKGAAALHLTACSFPGRGCPCGGCNENGTCSKPCTFLTTYYASGCWVAASNGATCCDCDCQGMPNDIPLELNHVGIGTLIHICGCGSDFQGTPSICP